MTKVNNRRMTFSVSLVLQILLCISPRIGSFTVPVWRSSMTPGRQCVLGMTKNTNDGHQSKNKISMLLDILKPATYFIEKQVVKGIIPDVSAVPNRKKLSNFAVVSNESSFDHSKWNTVLKRHVRTNMSAGRIDKVNVVDYAGVASDSDYASYLESLASSKPEELPQPEQLAFWINAYNALCVNIIVKHEKETGEKLDSINNLSTRKMAVWDMVAGIVGGQEISLNEIEHVKLREQWDEPAIHGCIVCASASCPNIRPEAFVVNTLREQMDDQMRDWLSNPTKGLVVEDGRLTLSRIFLWFDADFGGWEGILNWVPQFIGTDALLLQSEGTLKRRFFEYDWSINRLLSE